MQTTPLLNAVAQTHGQDRYTKLLQSVLHYNKELPPFVIPPSIISRVARLCSFLEMADWLKDWLKYIDN